MTLFLSGAILSAALAPAAQAATLQVPTDYASLSDAVAAASEGDTIQVKPSYAPVDSCVTVDTSLRIESSKADEVGRIEGLRIQSGAVALERLNVAGICAFEGMKVGVAIEGADVWSEGLEMGGEQDVGIMMTSGSLELLGATLQGYGGDAALIAATGSESIQITISDTEFADNSAGAIRLVATGGASLEALIEDSQFTRNQAQKGAGVSATGVSALKIEDSKFNGGSASIVGGAVYANNSVVKLAGVEADGVQASGGGALLYAIGGQVEILRSAVVDFSVGGLGGAVAGEGVYPLDIHQSRFCAGTTQTEDVPGVAVMTKSSGLTVQNNVFQLNAGGEAATVWSELGTLSVINNTFVGNDVNRDVYTDSNINETLTNNILYGGYTIQPFSAWSFRYGDAPTISGYSLYGSYSALVESIGSGAGSMPHDYFIWQDVEFWDDFAVEDCNTRPFLKNTSPAIQAGNPIFLDEDRYPYDLGAYGGVGEDRDFDGYGSVLDCDDNNAGVHPSATETWYDGVDQDCAGDNDFDADGDGHARQTEGDDCDDNEPNVHPEAPEVCNGRDDNCDQVIDEGCEQDTGDTGDTGPADDTGDPVVDTGSPERLPPGFVSFSGGRAACGGCASGSSGPWWLGLVALAGLQRRRNGPVSPRSPLETA